MYHGKHKVITDDVCKKDNGRNGEIKGLNNGNYQ